MSNTQFTFDPELFNGFIDDSLESLSSLEPIFIQLEHNPNDLEVIDSIFRPVHSIKGNAAFFDLIKLKNFAHTLETMLDLVRKKEISANHKIIEYLLLGTDELKAMLERVKVGEPEVADEVALEKLAKKIEEASSGSGLEQYCMQLSEQIHTVLAMANVEGLDQSAPELANEIKTLSDLNLIVTSAIDVASSSETNQTNEEVKGGTAYIFENNDLSETINTFSSLLEIPPTELADDAIENIEACMKTLTNTINKSFDSVCETMLDDFSTMMDSGIGYDDLLQGLLSEGLNTIKENTQTKVAISDHKDEQQAVIKDKPQKEKGNAAKTTSQNRTMRIAEEKIDNFMKYVGELIMISDSLNFLEHKLRKTDPAIAEEFHMTNMTFKDLSDQLQTSLLEIRKVPATGLTQRIPRMVRDLAESLGKQVEVNISGDDISIDKTLLEALGDPVTHLVRNCIDHGVESPVKRKEHGKIEHGTVDITLEQTGDQIFFNIKDDGAGIDPDIILKKAIEKGVIREQQAALMEKQQIYQLIFEPGFSTAAVVSDVSGRGVGMDVVRTNVEQLGGNIDIVSELGVGTEMHMTLPANTTVVVVSCVLIGVGESYLLVPLENILELIHPSEASLTNIQGQGEVFKIREKLYSVVRLHEKYNIETEKTKLTDGLIMLVESNHKRIALFADDVFGQQRVLIKELSGELAGIEGLSGAAILGDNKIGMVIDVPSIVESNAVTTN